MGTAGYAVNAIAVLLIVFFNIMFCFRKSLTPTHLTGSLLTPAHSIRLPDHRINHELQQCDLSRGARSHYSVVVHPRPDQVSGTEAGEFVCRWAYCGDAEG